MAMVIFTVLNGMGVVFLLYVLVQFWKEGHRSKRGATSHHAIEFWSQNRPEVLVVTHPICDCAPVGLSAVSMQAQERSPQGKEVHRDSGDRGEEMPLKRFSSRRRRR